MALSMFRSLRRSMAKAISLTRPRSLVAATAAGQKLAQKLLMPAKSKRTLSSKKSKPKTAVQTSKPRASLAENVRRIGAGGMPEKKAVTTSAKLPPRGSTFRLAQFASVHGKRSYKIYIPAQPPSAAPMPVIIMLHGCTQTPDDFAAGTGMNRLADKFGVIVVYPSQPKSANRNKCWNWFKPSDQGRDFGEPAVLAGIAQQVLRQHPGDAQRVYVAGLSAGGAAAAILATAYPDVFAAVGVHSGLPIGAAQNTVSALFAMRNGSSGDRQTVPMPTIIFHGEADSVVHPRNGRSVTARSVATFPALTEVTKTGRRVSGYNYRKTSYRAANRKSYCEYWAIKDAGHAWSGGDSSGSFTDPAGPDASREMLRFFLQHRRVAALVT